MKKILLILFILAFTLQSPVKAGSLYNVTEFSSSLIPDEFKVFPNPVTNKKFTIELSGHSLSEIRISNITGKMVYNRKFTLPVRRFEVSTENLPDGIYLLRVTTPDSSSRTIKLLISTHR